MPKLKDLERRASDATRKLYDAIESTFTPGMPVTVRHGEHLSDAEVLDTGFGRVKVRSVHGREYWVYAQRLLEFETL